MRRASSSPILRAGDLAAGSTMDDPRTLRKLAARYRALAEVTVEAESRRQRTELADHLDRCAAEAERRAQALLQGFLDAETPPAGD
jgi:hypothetical protein